MELKDYTRKIDREYNNILLKNSKMGLNGDGEVDPAQLQEANDYLVCAMTGKKQEEVDKMTAKEFNKIVAQINKAKGIEVGLGND